MKSKICKLIDVKSIVTIMLTAIFCLIALFGKVSAEQFLTIFTMIISFYYGTQATKNKKEDEKDEKGN